MTLKQSSSFRALFLLWLAGNGMRLTVLAVPPVLALIIVDLKLSGTEVGILNAIPVFLFALVAIPGSALIAKVGAVPALLIGLIITAVGSVLRGFSPGSAFLYMSTVFMAAGIAVMQPALPPTVRQWVPGQIGFATAVYTNGLLFGEIFPVMFAGLVLPLLSGSWRASLIFWSIPIVAVALVIFFCQPGGTNAPTVRRQYWMPEWRAPLLWKIGLMMGGANQLYFCTNAFLPGHLLEIGQSDWIGASLTALNVGQLPASFILLATASHWERKKWPLVGAGVIALLGVVGVVFGLQPWVIVGCAAMIGFACAVVLTIVLALPALMVEPDEVPRMSAGVFAIGYGIAVISSVLGGMAWDASQTPKFAFIPVAIAVSFIIINPLLTNFSARR